MTKPQYEYGFYDSDPDGTHRYDREHKPEPQENPHIWWFVFGLPFETPGMAYRSGTKSVWGRPVIVKRRKFGPKDTQPGAFEPMTDAEQEAALDDYLAMH